MKEHRSASQILFGFLPEQTVDLRGRIWRVDKWRDPLLQHVDAATLRRELIRLTSPWAYRGTDGDYGRHLRQGDEVAVLSLSRHNGISVVPFPEVWMCRVCKRVADSSLGTCKCGSKGSFGQLPFVHYHSCGALKAPFVPKCPEHQDVRVVLPGTASAGEIRFECPVCRRTLRKGLGFPRCQCGNDSMLTNVHRAASVFTPRTVVIVNPPSPEKVQRLTAAGGAERALSWILGGMTTAAVEEMGLTRAGLLKQLLVNGIQRVTAEAMVEAAASAGQLDQSDRDLGLIPERLAAAHEEAVTIALAVSEGRSRFHDLISGTEEWSELGVLYRDRYRPALANAKLEAVELVDTFPVLTGCYGYTRGQTAPGESRLVPFRDVRSNRYIVYGDVSRTEALFVRLEPTAVAQWLEARGHTLPGWVDSRSARLAILSVAEVPPPGAARGSDVGSELLTLVHSYCHRLIRRAAVIAGIDRNALSELIVPLHLSFFVYAAARGDFILGGLQAVFESELDKLLMDTVGTDHRCALDPGCKRAGGACVACLHLGEPSCRYFNSFLDRRTLSGVNGYLRGSAA